LKFKKPRKKSKVKVVLPASRSTAKETNLEIFVPDDHDNPLLRVCLEEHDKSVFTGLIGRRMHLFRSRIMNQ
jgi:hypothetical protein